MVADRKVLTFVVRVNDVEGDGALYLGLDLEGPLVPLGQAVQFEAYASTTTAERRKVQNLQAEVAGGAKAWFALELQSGQLWSRLRGEAEQALAPAPAAEQNAAPTAGQPGGQVQPREAAKPSAEAVRAYLRAREPDFLSMSCDASAEEVEEVRATAMLSVVLKAPEPYTALHPRALEPGRLAALWNAYLTAQEDLLAGKAQPSGS